MIFTFHKTIKNYNFYIYIDKINNEENLKRDLKINVIAKSPGQNPSASSSLG